MDGDQLMQYEQYDLNSNDEQ